MKILFSIYKEDYDTSITSLVYSKWISTEWDIKRIDHHLELYDHFHSNLVVGQTLSFWDIYCFYDDCQEIAKKIEEIPVVDSENVNLVSPRFIRVKEYNPGDADNAQYPELHNVFIYEINRYECGASSFDAIVYWISTHPFEMIFIGGFVYDIYKWIGNRILKMFNIRSIRLSKRPIFLKIGRFYSNFERITHVKKADCQIVKLNRMKTGVFSIIVRTISNEKYKVKCQANGKIESVEIVNKNKT